MLRLPPPARVFRASVILRREIMVEGRFSHGIEKAMFSDGLKIEWEGHPVCLRLKDQGEYKEDIYSEGVQPRPVFYTPVYERVSFFLSYYKPVSKKLHK